jgi:hypothetical protein
VPGQQVLGVADPRLMKGAGGGCKLGSFSFDLLDLEIIDRVYEAAWARVEAARALFLPAMS